MKGKAGRNGHLKQPSALASWLVKLKDSEPHCSRNAVPPSHRFCRTVARYVESYAADDDLSNIVLFHRCTCQLLLSNQSNDQSLDLPLDPAVLGTVNGAVSGTSRQ